MARWLREPVACLGDSIRIESMRDETYPARGGATILPLAALLRVLCVGCETCTHAQAIGTTRSIRLSEVEATAPWLLIQIQEQAACQIQRIGISKSRFLAFSA